MHSTGRPICALLLCVLLTHVSLSGAQQAAPQQPTASSTANKFVLDDGTPIKLRLDRNLSSADAKTGDNIDFVEIEKGRFEICPRTAAIRDLERGVQETACESAVDEVKETVN